MATEMDKRTAAGHLICVTEIFWLRLLPVQERPAVLVERIISMITDEKNPVDVDKLLVVTYTEAAAAETGERIAAAIEKLEESPGNLNLEQQASLIHSAIITTVHYFSLSVIRMISM